LPPGLPFCRQLEIAGATVFRGLEGYGETAELHRAHMLRHDQPIVIVVADMAEQVAALAQAVEPMMDTGLMAASDVEMIRLQGRDGAAVL
jgi:PII-like signaling protein